MSTGPMTLIVNEDKKCANCELVRPHRLAEIRTFANSIALIWQCNVCGVYQGVERFVRQASTAPLEDISVLSRP
jgi:hypothetical protein